MFRLKSLRQKLIACFLLLTLLPLAGTTLYGLFFTRSVLSDQALERSAFQVDLQVESIAGALRQVQNDIEYLHALRSLNMLRQQTDSEQIALWQREVANDMLVLASVRPMYHSVNLYDKSGDPMVLIETHDDTVAIVGPRDSVASNSAFIPEGASGVALPADMDPAFAADSGSAFRKTLALPIGQAYVSSVQFDDEEGIPFIRYSVRLPDSVLMIDLHPGWLLRSLPQHPGADTWAMIDQDGQFWVYPAGFDVASVADDIPHLLIGASGRYETPTYNYAFDVIHPTDRTLASPSPELVTEQDGSTLLDQASSDMTTSLSVSEPGQPTSDRYWVLFRRTPTTVLYADLNNFYRMAIILVVASAAVAIWMAVNTGQWLVTPLHRLQTMAIQFGRTGTMTAVTQRQPDDEVGALTRTFIDLAHELENKRRREHRLLESLINAQEEERKLLAYDLHDGLIQQMVGARFYLTNCRDACPIPETPRGSIQRGCDALSQAIIEGRRIIEGLRPAVLDDLGLRSAIEETAQTNATAAGWELELNLHNLPAEPEKTVAVTLFRIAQEAFNNIRKHANARHVQVSLHNGDGITMTIRDDGSGFDLESISREGRGVGITAMQERAALLQGECKITSRRGAGTVIEVHIPWEASQSPVMSRGPARVNGKENS